MGVYNWQLNEEQQPFIGIPNWQLIPICCTKYDKLTQARKIQSLAIFENLTTNAKMKLKFRQSDFQSLPFQQFQVLFNSPFEVLFIFRSRYFFAIGIPPVFSCGRSLPPILCCTPKQHDSNETY